MYLRKRLCLIAVALLPLLASCGATSTGCDPARAGFWESMHCSEGGFQARQAKLESELATAQGFRAQEAIAADAEAANAAKLKRGLVERQAALSALDDRLVAMKAQLQDAANWDGSDKAALQRIKARLEDLQRRKRQIARADPDDDEIRKIDGETDRLGRGLQDALRPLLEPAPAALTVQQVFLHTVSRKSRSFNDRFDVR